MFLRATPPHFFCIPYYSPVKASVFLPPEAWGGGCPESLSGIPRKTEVLAMVTRALHSFLGGASASPATGLAQPNVLESCSFAVLPALTRHPLLVSSCCPPASSGWTFSSPALMRLSSLKVMCLHHIMRLFCYFPCFIKIILRCIFWVKTN